MIILPDGDRNIERVGEGASLRAAEVDMDKFDQMVLADVADTVLVLLMDSNGDLHPRRLKNNRPSPPRKLRDNKDCETLSIRRMALAEAFSIIEVETEDGCRVLSGNGGGVYVPCR